MYDFSGDGFFGYGNKGDFKNFSLAHIIPLLILIAAIVLTYIYREKIRSYKYEGRVRFILAFIAIIVEMSYFWRIMYVGSGKPDVYTLSSKYPLQLCQWGLIISSFMFMSKNKTLFTTSYFVTLFGATTALLMPAAVISNCGPAYYRYYQFFLEHMMPIYFVFYFIFVHGYKPELKRLWLFVAFMVVLTGVCIFANSRIEGANYLYLAAKTDGSSIANFFPENIAVRTLIYGCILAVVCFLLYLPYFISYLKNRNKRIIEE